MRIKKNQQPRPRPPTPVEDEEETGESPRSTPPTKAPPSPSTLPSITLPQLEKMNFDNRIKRKNVLALNEKVAAIREYSKMPVYKYIGRLFNCSPDQIKRIIQQREIILKAWEQRTRRCQDAKTLEMKVVRVSMLGLAVYDWIRRMMYYKDFIITDGLIQKMALQFKSAMGLQNFFPHQEWCDKFRDTYNITQNDTKMLSIGYSQGHSVQIKDIIKDVLTECTPDSSKRLNINANPSASAQSSSGGDDSGGGRQNDNEENDESKEGDNSEDDDTSDEDTDTENKDEAGDADRHHNANRSLTKLTLVPPQISTQILPPPLQPLHQLLALPINTNGLPGTTQKVLVATPISTPGQPRKDASAPMTMTIIPIATLAQSVQQQHHQKQDQNQKKGNANTSTQRTVPPPIMDIKKEIKEEPSDDEPKENESVSDSAPQIFIKQEVISDDEESSRMKETSPLEANQNISSVDEVLKTIKENKKAIQKELEEHQNEVVATSIQKENKANLEVHSSQFQSATISHKTQRSAIGTRSSSGNRNISKSKSKTKPKPEQPLPLPLPMIQLPALPMKTKRAPAAPGPLTIAAKKRKLYTREYRKHNNNNNVKSTTSPAIKSCTEARKYLKMLEEFALHKQNYRLIGLITRADEILRDSDEDCDDDIDID